MSRDYERRVYLKPAAAGYVPALVIFIIFLTVSSCQPKKKAVSAAGTAEVPKKSVVSEKKKLVFGTLEKGKVSGGKDTGSVSAVAEGNIPAELLTVSPSASGTPEDMVIGELQQYWSLPADEKLLYRRIERFFTSLSAGKQDAQDLHPLWSDAILHTLGEVVLEKHFRLRIGVFAHRDSAIDARIRILTTKGRSSGEITAEKDKGTWLISDIAMDFSKLEQPYSEDNKKFEPDSYMNVRLEYE